MCLKLIFSLCITLGISIFQFSSAAPLLNENFEIYDSQFYGFAGISGSLFTLDKEYSQEGIKSIYSSSSNSSFVYDTVPFINSGYQSFWFKLPFDWSLDDENFMSIILANPNGDYALNLKIYIPVGSNSIQICDLVNENCFDNPISDAWNKIIIYWDFSNNQFKINLNNNITAWFNSSVDCDLSRVSQLLINTNLTATLGSVIYLDNFISDDGSLDSQTQFSKIETQNIFNFFIQFLLFFFSLIVSLLLISIILKMYD